MTAAPDDGEYGRPDANWPLDPDNAYCAADLDDLDDIDTGVQQILLVARNAALDEGLDELLDLEAGLQAIFSLPRPITASPSNPQVRGLGAALERLPLPLRLSLRTTCWRAVEQAMLAMHILSDEFHALLRQCRLLPELDPYLGDVGREIGGSVPELMNGNIRYSLEMMTQRLDDEVFDAFGDLVETLAQSGRTPQRPLTDWVNAAYDVFWQTGSSIVHSIRELEYAIDAYPVNAAQWFAYVQHWCGVLRSQLGDYTRDLRYLDKVLNDFTDTDLRGADLKTAALTGLRWSSKTRWPPTWAERVLAKSITIAAGTFEVRPGGQPLLMVDGQHARRPRQRPLTKMKIGPTAAPPARPK